MKKLITFLIINILSASICHAQDLIILRNGKEIMAKVIEIGPKEIKFRESDNPDRPSISILKSNVLMIRYKDGMIDTISHETGKFKNKPLRVGLFADPLGFVLVGPSAGTELTVINHLIIDSYITFPSVGLLAKYIYMDEENFFPGKISGMAAGAGIKGYIPFKSGGLYIGTTLEYGRVTCIYQEGSTRDKTKNLTYILSMASIGYKIRFQSGFYINTGGNFGFHYGIESDWHYANSDHWNTERGYLQPPVGMLEVACGYEF